MGRMSDATHKSPASNLRKSAPRFAFAAALLLAAGGLMALFHQAGGAFFPAYRSFSKGIEGALASITGFVPISIWDVGLVPIGIAIVASLAWCIVRKRSVLKWVASICAIVAALLFFLVGAWGLNHYAPPLADELGLEVGEYSADELEAATAYYLAQAAERAQSVPRADDKTLERQDFHALAGIAGASYDGLDAQYPVFEGSTARVKELTLLGDALLYSGHTGIFWPFTGEANVPANTAVSEMPFIQCHEAAHRLGIASEQEANFAAFLACTEGSAAADARFAYSGYYEAFCYCLNALAQHYPQRAQDLMQTAIGDKVDPTDAKTYGARLVLFDRYTTADYYRTYEGPAEEVGTSFNDAYLKTFSEESGIQSYGEVADYLIAWHQAQVKSG